jgi:hypothetical protein
MLVYVGGVRVKLGERVPCLAPDIVAGDLGLVGRPCEYDITHAVGGVTRGSVGTAQASTGCDDTGMEFWALERLSYTLASLDDIDELRHKGYMPP